MSDLNKMPRYAEVGSDTPRTDAMYKPRKAGLVTVYSTKATEDEKYEHARTLERELTALREKLTEMCVQDEAHRKAQAEIYLALGAIEPARAKWPERIRALRARLEEAEKDAARWKWGVANARWIRHEHEAYIAIPVALDADLSCLAMRQSAIDSAMGGRDAA